MYRTAIGPCKLFQERREYVGLVGPDKIILGELLHLNKESEGTPKANLS